MRTHPTILHLDMDAFFAAVEQASKPSLRGKPVIVGGLGSRGVVSTASYEARPFGVHSAMPTAQARRRCPHAAYLAPRFGVYRQISDQVMALLAALSPLVEPLSLDEAFVDLEAAEGGPPDDPRKVGEELREAIVETTGLTGSVGLAGSKMLAKIASERAKPDGLVLIPPGTEREMLAGLPVRTLPGVGPATAESLRRAGIATVGEMALAGETELVRLLGTAHGQALSAMAVGVDDRPVVADRDSKSISVEDTFEVDVTDRARLRWELARMAERCTERLREAGRSGRTVVIKVRSPDFTTLTRSETLRGPTDDPTVVQETATRLLEGVDTSSGVRLLGVGVSGLATFTQEDLFAQATAVSEDAGAAGEEPSSSGGTEVGGAATPPAAPTSPAAPAPSAPSAVHGRGARPGPAAEPPRRWSPGADVRHTDFGPGWVQGSGVGRVTVRFEEPGSAPGRVRTFRIDDPELMPSEPLPLVPEATRRGLGVGARGVEPGPPPASEEADPRRPR